MLRKILYISALISIVTVGCKKDFLDQNVDPNYPTDIPASKVLPAALGKTAYLMIDQNLDFANIWMGFWSFSSTYGIPANQRNYDYPAASDKQGFFTNVYSNAYDYQGIINQSIASQNKAMEGIGRIMKSMVMQMGVDVYGNIPYTQAFLATANLTPKYDDASAIYDSLYNDVSKGLKLLHAAKASDFPDKTSDLMFGGDSTKWFKFANTLKLKLLIRQAGVASKASYISAKIASDFVGDLSDFMGAGDIAKINPGYSNSAANKQTPFWNLYGFSTTNTVTAGSELDYYRGGINAINFYADQNDLRLLHFMDYTAYDFTGGILKGVDPNFYNVVQSSQLSSNIVYFDFAGTEMGKAPVAAAGTILPPTFSNLATNKVLKIRTPSDDALIFSDFEALFLQAEAVQRGWFPSGDAMGLFNSAVAQSFTYDFDGPLGAGAGAGIAGDLTIGANNDWNTATDPIKLIITQKYMAMACYNNVEPWAEYRRTGFPDVVLSSIVAPGKHIPYRYLYPQREYSVNGSNVPTQVAGDQFTSKIFWIP